MIWTIEDHALSFNVPKHGAPLIVQTLVHQLSLSIEARKEVLEEYIIIPSSVWTCLDAMGCLF